MEVIDIEWELLKESQAIQDLCWTAQYNWWHALCVCVCRFN